MVYFIRETWRMKLFGNTEIEKHDEKEHPVTNVCKDLKAVKKWIRDWIETWKENAGENEYKFLDFKTDYKTFAKCRIKTGMGIDNFSLKVIEAIK